MIVLSLIVGVVALALWLPTFSDLASLLRAATSRHATGKSADRAPPSEPPRLLFLIPAHDEESMISDCLRSLQRLAYPPDRFAVIVVADNCRDRTAELARQHHARVLERHDEQNRGKPYAIAWALDQIDLSDHDAVIIVDADAIVDPDFARELSASGPLTAIAAQAYHDVRNPGEHPMTRMAAVLARAYYEFSFPLKQRGGLNVPLTGPGMTLGSDLLRRHGWKAFSICEDIEVYTQLTAAGERTIGAPRARVYSQEARSLRQASTQRQRWRGGRLAVLSRSGWSILSSRRIGPHQKLDVIAELAGPGPALHAGLIALLVPVVLILSIPGAAWLAVALASSLARPTAYTLAALRADPEPAGALISFLYLPVYVVWRLGTELKAWKAGGEKSWIRTERH